MGTRHIVEVIKDKKTVIRQYGQWDGYAETAAYQLRNFIKKHGAQKTKELMELTEIQNTRSRHEDGPDMLITPDGFHMAESMLCAVNEIAEYLYKLSSGTFLLCRYGISDVKLVSIPAVVEKFGLEKAMNYYMLTRDTGYKVLDTIGIFSCFDKVASGECEIPVFLEEEDLDPGRKIIIDLDKETFTCKYFKKEQTWTFEKLPTLAELRKVDKW